MAAIDTGSRTFSRVSAGAEDFRTTIRSAPVPTALARRARRLANGEGANRLAGPVVIATTWLLLFALLVANRIVTAVSLAQSHVVTHE